MLRTVNLSKYYRSEEVETKALNKVSLHILPGEFVSIMGPSGCGKSTLLNILGMIDTSTAGDYFLDGTEVSHLKERQRAQIRKENIGFVFQSFNLIEELNVFENVELPLIYTGMKSRMRRQRVEEVLDRMSMMHRKNHFPQQLSGGQQQRVAVARAIVNKPRLLLADEPTGNLDTQQGSEVMRLLSDLNAEGATVVMVTHSPKDAEYGNRIIRLLDGAVIAENTLKTQVI